MSGVMLRDRIDEQNRVWTRMQEIQKRAEDEKRDWTAEERTNWDEANARIEVVSADIERLDRMAKLETVDYRQVLEPAEQRTPGNSDTPEDTQEARDKAFDAAFSKFVRRGTGSLGAEERAIIDRAASENRAAGETIPSAGGYLVPPGFRTTMTESLKAFGGLINHANVITTSTGNPLQWPTNDDTSNTGAILAENTQLSELDVTIGTRAVGAYTYTSKLVRVSLQLLTDSAFDINSWLPRKLGERIGRAVADDLVNGSGIGEPTGLLPSATLVTPSTATSSAAWAANTTGLGYDALVDLEHSIDPAYRAAGSCRYVFNDNTLKQIRKFKDADLRPIWVPVPVVGMAATVNGLPYSIDQGMPNQATTSRFILFGDFNAGYIVRQVLDVQMVRLAERYADYLQVGFFGFSRLDAVPDDAGAVKALGMTS